MPPQMTLRFFLPRHWLSCCVLVWLVAVGVVRAEVGGIERRPVAGGAEVVLMKTGDVESYTGGVQSSYPIASIPGLYMRLQDVHAVFSNLESRSAPSATVADEEELLLAQLDAMAWPRVDTALTGLPPRYFRYDLPWVRSDFFSKVRFADWEPKLPCRVTVYDDAVAELRAAYLLYEIYSTELLAQSAQSFDELAFSALIVHELEKAGF